MTTPNIVNVDPDSQYRLVPCECGNAEPAYIWRAQAAAKCTEWAVVCTRCRKATKWHPIRHDAQLEWNGRK